MRWPVFLCVAALGPLHWAGLYLFIYFLSRTLIACLGLLLVAVLRLFIAVAPLLAERRLSSVGFSSCSAWHVGSSWTRDGTHILCIDRQTLNHWATREAPPSFLSSWKQSKEDWYCVICENYTKLKFRCPQKMCYWNTVTLKYLWLLWHYNGCWGITTETWWPAKLKLFTVWSFFFFFLATLHYLWDLIVPWSELEPAPSAVKTLSPNHWTNREFHYMVF